MLEHLKRNLAAYAWTVGLSALGLLSMGATGALPFVLAAPLLAARFGGDWQAQVHGDSVWPTVIMMGLAWPWLIVPAHLVVGRVAPRAKKAVHVVVVMLLVGVVAAGLAYGVYASARGAA